MEKSHFLPRMGDKELIPLVTIVVLALMTILSCCTDVYAKVVAETGLDHYAERPWRGFLPLNSIVNLCYILPGVIWLKGRDPWTHAFAWMSLLYGPVQLLRITTQSHGWAVLDQWVTLPIFAWFVCWCGSVCLRWSNTTVTGLMAMSIVSYNLVFYLPEGFDVALGVHILLAVVLSMWICFRHANGTLLKTYGLALASCAGFVVLKLLDHDLATLHPLFTVFTGHFLSKICDASQIHFGCLFIEGVRKQQFKKFKM